MAGWVEITASAAVTAPPAGNPCAALGVYANVKGRHWLASPPWLLSRARLQCLPAVHVVPETTATS